MYGLGGGFGGMPYQSPAGAIAGGIEAGQHYMMMAQQEEDRREQFRLQDARQARMEAREDAHYKFMERNVQRQQAKDDWRDARDAHKIWQEDLRNRMGAVIEKYGGDAAKIQQSPEYQQLQPEIQQWNAGNRALMDAAYAPFLKLGNDRAQEWSQGMQREDPNFDPMDPNNAQDLHHMISAATKVDPAIFIQGPNGEPSQFQKASQDIHAGFTNDDANRLYSGMDGVFGNQFAAGRLGDMDPMGGTVSGVSLNKDRPFVPTPDGQGVHPVLSITGETADGGYTTQPMAAPRKVGWGGPAPGDLQSFSFQKMFDHLGTMGSIQALVSHPAIQTNLAKAAKNPDQRNLDWAQAYTALGGKPSLGGDLKPVHNSDGSEDWVYLPHTANGYGAPVTVVRGDRTPKEKAQPEGMAEAQEIVKSGAINPATQKPFASVGEVFASKLKLGQPNEAEVQRQSEAESELVDLQQGFYRDPVLGLTPGFKIGKDGRPVLDDKGEVQWDPQKKALIDARIADRKKFLETHQKGFTEGGRPQPTGGPPKGIQEVNPAPQTPEDHAEHDQVMGFLNRAGQDPHLSKVSPQQILEGLIKRGVLKPSARRWAAGPAGAEPQGAGAPTSGGGTPPPAAGARPAPAPAKGIPLEQDRGGG